MLLFIQTWYRLSQLSVAVLQISPSMQLVMPGRLSIVFLLQVILYVYYFRCHLLHPFVLFPCSVRCLSIMNLWFKSFTISRLGIRFGANSNCTQFWAINLRLLSVTAYPSLGYGRSKKVNKIWISQWSFNGVAEQFIVFTFCHHLDFPFWRMGLFSTRVSRYFSVLNLRKLFASSL